MAPTRSAGDDGRRRIVLSANASGRALSDVVADIRQVTGDTTLPAGYFITLGGQFQAQEEASRLIGLLSAGVCGPDLLHPLFALPLGGAGGHHHGQHSTGAGGGR